MLDTSLELAMRRPSPSPSSPPPPPAFLAHRRPHSIFLSPVSPSRLGVDTTGSRGVHPLFEKKLNQFVKRKKLAPPSRGVPFLPPLWLRLFLPVVSLPFILSAAETHENRRRFPSEEPRGIRCRCVEKAAAAILIARGRSCNFSRSRSSRRGAPRALSSRRIKFARAAKSIARSGERRRSESRDLIQD